MNKVLLEISGLSYGHSETEAYALFLTEVQNTNRRLPIVIGKAEAQAIAVCFEELESPRPLTHELLKSVIEILDGELVEVNIIKLISGVFYAEICLMQGVKTHRIDARVSDAVTLAIRYKVPIYCTEEVMQTSKQLEMMLNDAVREENYEQASLLKKELDKRK